MVYETIHNQSSGDFVFVKFSPWSSKESLQAVAMKDDRRDYWTLKKVSTYEYITKRSFMG